MTGLATLLTAVTLLAVPVSASASSRVWKQIYQANAHGVFSQVAAISATNIWAVGELSTKKGRTLYRPFIRHYNGSGWQTVTIPGSPRFRSDYVSASSADNIWVIGVRPGSVYTSMVYRYDGSR